MNERELLDQLGQTKFLRPLTYPALRRLAAQGRVLHVKEGMIVIGPELGSKSAFLVLEGSIAAVMPWGPIMAYLGPGELFGEMALLAGVERSAYCKAAVDSVIFEIPFACFHNDLLANPVVRDGLEEMAVNRQQVQIAIRQGGPSPELTPPTEEDRQEAAEGNGQEAVGDSAADGDADAPSKKPAPQPPAVYASA